MRLLENPVGQRGTILDKFAPTQNRGPHTIEVILTVARDEVGGRHQIQQESTEATGDEEARLFSELLVARDEVGGRHRIQQESTEATGDEEARLFSELLDQIEIAGPFNCGTAGGHIELSVDGSLV